MSRGACASVIVAASIASLVCFGCVTDHDLFATTDGSGGKPKVVGIVSGAGGMGGHSSGGAPSPGGTAGRGTGGAPRPAEPPGPIAMSFLNGVTDAPSVSLCFAKIVNGIESAPAGKPFPDGTLSYGKPITVASVADLNLTTDAVRPYVIAAAPDAISGLDCASILVIAKVQDPPTNPGSHDASLDGSTADATALDGAPDGDAREEAPPAPVPVPPDDSGPQVPAIRAFALPVIAVGTFTAERHYLFGLAGCMGGPGITDPSEQSICGESFSTSNPTLAPVLVTLSRIVTKDHVALQFANASSRVRAADIRLASKSLNPLSLAKNVVMGAIRPIPPNASRAAAQFGLTDEDKIQLFADGSSKPIYDEPWSKTLAPSSIQSLQDGHAYTLLLIGPYPGFHAQRWWNEPLVTIIAND